MCYFTLKNKHFLIEIKSPTKTKEKLYDKDMTLSKDKPSLTLEGFEDFSVKLSNPNDFELDIENTTQHHTGGILSMVDHTTLPYPPREYLIFILKIRTGMPTSSTWKSR
mgnify:CR=1 FL=1